VHFAFDRLDAAPVHERRVPGGEASSEILLAVAEMLSENEPAFRSSSYTDACLPIETPMSGGSSESDTSDETVTPIVSRSFCTDSTATGCGTNRMSRAGLRRSPPFESRRRDQSLADASPPGGMRLVVVVFFVRLEPRTISGSDSSSSMPSSPSVTQPPHIAGDPATTTQ